MKQMFFFLLSLFYAPISFAENGYAEHALMVHHLSYWAPEYLTITNNWNNLNFVNAPSTLKSLSVITEIDGQSTIDMEPKEFYSIIDKESTFNITYMTKIKGENKTYSQRLTKRNGKLFCYDSSNSVKWYSRGGGDYSLFQMNLSDNDITIFSALSIDFFLFNTFDYIVDPNDEMTDKGLLLYYSKELESKGLKQDSNNPDIYLYLTKEENTNIESVYVPHIVSTTKKNSHTRGSGTITNGNYSSWGFGRSNTRETSTTHTRDIGRTNTVVNIDLYLQFSILNAKQMDSKTPPVIWQLTCKGHWDNERNVMDIMKSLRSIVYAYPSSSQKIGRKICSFGVFLQDNPSVSGIVSDIIPNSMADNSGIEIENKFKKIKRSAKWIKTYVYNLGKGDKIDEDEIGWGEIDFYFNTKKIHFKKAKQWSIEDDEIHDIDVPYYFIPESEIE